MQWFAHAANVLFLFSFLVRDILWLRMFSVIGGGALIPYYLYGADKILWVPFGWNLVFMTINVVQSYRLILERRPVRLTAAERALHERAFSSLSPRAFLTLLAVGEWRSVEPDVGLVFPGEPLSELLVIADGAVTVHVEERQVAQLDPGAFVGEMSYLTGQVPKASVVASEPTSYVAWPCAVLKKHLDDDPDLRSGLQLILGTDLAHKLRRA